MPSSYLHELLLNIISFQCIKLSNPDVTLNGRDYIVDWIVLPIKRKIISRLKGVEVVKVSPALNRPGDALCFAEQRYLFADQINHVPIAVLNALANDNYPRHCFLVGQIIHV